MHGDINLRLESMRIPPDNLLSPPVSGYGPGPEKLPKGVYQINIYLCAHIHILPLPLACERASYAVTTAKVTIYAKHMKSINRKTFCTVKRMRRRKKSSLRFWRESLLSHAISHRGKLLFPSLSSFSAYYCYCCCKI